MAKQDSRVQRTKLFRMVHRCFEYDCEFKPKIADCREVFRNINRQVFNNELKMPRFRITSTDEFWGMCVGHEDDPGSCTIYLNNRFLSKRLFVYTMAHEMVHQWEWLTNENMTHGPQFFQWRDQLAKFGIVLSRRYRIKHYRLD